ncbi:MAG: tetratricopeptide repeat protein [Flavobacteriales bacterium]|nr:tetratricopeptide repeat protein [Flavobacteriales bacterium]
MKFFKILSLALLLLLTQVQTYSAQISSVEEEKIDSLQQVISISGSNKEIIKAYFAWDHINNDSQLAFEIYQKIELLCKESLQTQPSEKEEFYYLKRLSQAHNSFGILYKLLGNYDKSILSYSNSIRICDQIGDTIGMIAALVNIGNLHFGSSNYDKALEYYFKSQAFQKSTGNDRQVAASYLNIANVYVVQENQREAIESYKKSLALFKGINEKRGESIALLNLGIAFHELKEYDKAIEFCEQCLTVNEELNDQQVIAYTLTILGKVHIGLTNYPKAITYSKRALKIAEELEATNEIMEASHNLYKSYSALKDHRRALTMHERYIDSRDSILSKENLDELIHQEYKYLYEKQAIADSVVNEESKKLLEADLKTQKAVTENEKKEKMQFLFWSVGGGVILSLIVFFLLRNNAIRKKANKKLSEKNEEIAKTSQELSETLDERNLLLKEIHHRVKNNLQTVSSLLSLQSRYLDDPTASKALEESQNRLLSISLLHQKLYQNENLPVVDFAPYLKELTNQISETCARLDQNIRVVVKSDDLLCDIELAMPLGLMVNELMTNSYKYAFKDKKEGNIMVSFKCLEDQQMELEVSDDGVGLPVDFSIEKSNSMGLNLVKLLTRQVKGAIEINGQNGATFLIRFKRKSKYR